MVMHELLLNSLLNPLKYRHGIGAPKQPAVYAYMFLYKLANYMNDALRKTWPEGAVKSVCR